MKDFRGFIILLFSFWMINNFSLLAQNDTIMLGGVVNRYSKVTAIDYECNYVEVTDPSFFPVDSTVLLIQMQGALIDETNTNLFGDLLDLQEAGSYEMATVKFVMDNRVYFTTQILRQYFISGAVQLIYVPNHENIRISTPVAASPWNGSTGGVVAIKSKNRMILNAEINATQQGYRGGSIGYFPSHECLSTRYYETYSNVQDGEKGEGIAGWISGKETSRGKNLNGGGGGNYHNCGGGGGGNGGAGGIGGRAWSGCNPPPVNYGGIGGYPIASIDANQLFLGGGGGGGNANDHQGSPGGSGGGLVILIFNELQANNSSVKVNGQTVTQIARLDSSGGGGAGGTVVLYGTIINGTFYIESKGGNGGQIVHPAFNELQQWGSGGGGGGGQVLTNLQSLNSTTINLSEGQFGSIPANGSWGAENGLPGVIRYNISFPFLEVDTSGKITINSDSLFYCDIKPEFIELPCDNYMLLNDKLQPIQTILNDNKYYLDLAAEGIYHLYFMCLDESCLGVFYHYKITTQTQPESNVTLHLCRGDTINYAGYTFEYPGQFLINIPRHQQCDSVINLVVLEHQSYVVNINTTICDGETYTFFDQELSVEGEYQKTFMTNFGCDSIYKLQLTKLPSEFESFHFEICSGDSIFFNNQFFKEEEVFVFVHLNSKGCDSIIEFNLKVHPTYFTQLTQKSCFGNSYSFFDLLIDTSGTYRHMLSSNTGCDSIFELDIYFEDIKFNSFFENICHGDTLLFNGKSYSQPGVYIDTLIASEGCDSIVELNLQIHSSFLTQINQYSCFGTSYPFFDLVIETSGIYRHTLSSISGCDSIIELNIFFEEYLHTSIHESICQGDTVYLNGKTYSLSGVYKDTLITSWGCDSIIELDLQVLPTYLTQINHNLCFGTSYPFFDLNIDSSGIYKHTLSSTSGCDSIIELNIEFDNHINFSTYENICHGDTFYFNGKPYNKSGVFKDTIISSNGCDSILVLELDINPAYSFLETITICENSSFIFFNDTIVDSGRYSKLFESIDGCDSLVSIEVKVIPKFKFVEFIQTDKPYIWNVNNIQYFESGEYKEHFFNRLGCDSIHILDLQLIPSTAVFAPLAFTPDKNGINDRFTIFGTENIKEIEILEIFDRWGDLIGRFNNFPASDTNFGWDGTMNGIELMAGIYVFHASVVFHSGHKVNLNGEVTLIR